MEIAIRKKDISYPKVKTGTLPRLWRYILVLYLIFITDSFLFSTYDNSLFKAINRYSVILLGVVLIVFEFIIKNREIKPILLLLTASVFMSAFLAGRFTNGYSYYTMIAGIWISYVISRHISLKEFAHIYCSEMRIIAICSLLGWVFSKQIVGLGLFPVLANTNGVSYVCLLLTNIPTQFNLRLRNMGPFWEPGAYQFYLVVALFFSLFIQKNRLRVFDILLFVVTALSTISGVVLFPIVILISAYFIKMKRFSNLFFIAALLLVILAFYQSGLFDKAISKMRGESDSLVYRWIGIEGPVRALFTNPIFGATPEVNDTIKTSLAIKYLGISYGSNANTFFNFFGYYGLFVGSYMLFNAFKMLDDSIDTKLVVCLCFLAFVISSSNENFTGSLFLVTLIGLRQRSFLKQYENS